MERHFFASAITGNGFVNYSNTITDGVYTYVLKGGSGSGKSTIIRAIANHFSSKGYDVELYHCSRDETGLDGVRISGLGIAIVDGTHPHVIEPSIVGITGRYIDLSGYLDPAIIHERNEIYARVNSIKELTAKVKSDLASVVKTHNEVERIYNPYMNFDKVQKVTKDLISDIAKKNKS